MIEINNHYYYHIDQMLFMNSSLNILKTEANLQDSLNTW